MASGKHFIKHFHYDLCMPVEMCALYFDHLKALPPNYWMVFVETENMASGPYVYCFPQD